MKKVCFCIPTRVRPWDTFIDSLEAEVPLIKEAGWEEGTVWEIGGAYVSYNRAILLRKALRWLKDSEGCIVFLDDDISWKPGDLLKLIETKGDIAAGTYRFKDPLEKYMGRLEKLENSPIPEPRFDGCLSAFLVPAGFLKVSQAAIHLLVERYPKLDFSRPHEGGDNHYDIFNHGVIAHTWFGEDYAFSLRWKMMKQKLWLVPDLSIDHWARDAEGKPIAFRGNFAKYLENPENRAVEEKLGHVIMTSEVTATIAEPKLTLMGNI